EYVDGYAPGRPVGDKRWSGEVTVVDLGDGKYLFALVNEPVSLAQDTFKYLVKPRVVHKGKNGIRYYTNTLFPRFIEEIREKAPAISEHHYPTLVTFEDIKDSRSIKLVDPSDLAATFGDGYALKEITLEITGENVQYGKIKNVLDWIDDPSARKIGRKPPRIYGDPLYALAHWDFIKKQRNEK
ncbi:MAG: hypothetical protein OCD03_05430, partial [Hyphomicrobiales bacterium]